MPPTAAPWPSQEEIFFVEGWNVSSATVERINGMDYVSGRYWRADGTAATFVLSTSPVAKTVYRAGADVPFHGSGYTVAPAPKSPVSSSEVAAFTARKENEEYPLLYAFGERRGFLGNGLNAWSLVALDAVVGHPTTTSWRACPRPSTSWTLPRPPWSRAVQSACSLAWPAGMEPDEPADL